MVMRGNPARLRRRAVSVAAVLASVSLLGAACSSDSGNPIAAGDEPQSGEQQEQPTPSKPQAKITISPDDQASDVRLDAPVSVRASKGKLTKVTVTDSDGKPLKGQLNQDKTTWKADGPMEEETEYTVKAIAQDEWGKDTSSQQKFSTLDVSQVLGSDIMPEDGSHVGVGYPIAIEFTNPVENKGKIEKRLEVETSKPVEGSWHWFDDDTVHYRPKKYWPADTDVTLRTHLKGVDAGSDVWGIKNKERTFHIGNSVVSKVDLDSHQQKTYINGKLARTIPITSGKPGWETRSGTKVVLGKERDKTFTDEQIDAEEDYELRSPYAIRVTWSGEFLHTASWSTWAHGKQNVSHGCVGMSEEDSGWLYENTQIGDVVEFTGSTTPMEDYGNGYGDWNLSWSEWQEGSSLP